MAYDFLANLLETGILCQVGDIAMHFAVHFYVFYNIFAIGFQAAIEIVQVFMPETLRAVALNSFVGMVFDSGSYLFCFQPDTRS